MDRTKLTYFDFPGGRGEDCRLALYFAEVDFEDDRIQGADWREHKPKTPFGALPVLYVPGMGELAQSNAILAYVGREHGLHPENAWEAAQHEAVMASVEDVRAQVGKATSEDASDKQKAREALAEGWLKSWATTVDQMILGPFMAGDRMQVVDLKLFTLMRWFSRGDVDHISVDYFDQFPKLRALRDAIGSLDKVVEWYAEA